MMRYTIIYLCLMTQLTACQLFSPKDGAPTYPIDVSTLHDAIPKVEPLSPYGNPPFYYVHGHRYDVLNSTEGYDKVGYASWYGTKFQDHLTSSRERYDPAKMTAASRTLPIPCYVRVINLANGESVVVRVNDRGPFKSNRILDLSYAAAKKLGFADKGTTLVRVTAIDVQPIKPIYLQAGAFRDWDKADRFRERIAQTIHAPVAVTESEQGDQPTMYHVQIGPLSNAQRSHQIVLLLKKMA